MAKAKGKEQDLTTEEKIKEAARTVFTRKGYAATKTRDIAEEAGLNLALLNYYFRSKDNLFEIVMIEKMRQLFAFLAPILNDQTTTLDQKIDQISERYIDLLLANPDLPMFVLSEIRNNPGRFSENIKLDTFVLKSHFIQQLAEKKKDVNPLQILLSFLGMLVFPFVAKPVFSIAGAVDEMMFSKMMEERKVLVAQWLKLIINS